LTTSTEQVFIVHPWLKKPKEMMLRGADSCVEEAIGLAHAIDLKVVGTAAVALPKTVPATLIGSGKVEELAEEIKSLEAGLAIVNHALSPIQQRNLEKAWNCKVIDRTALILEIFGARARTHEGKLQVELAALEYQKGRLVRSWTHLERQRGGFGFLGGPGESQIEIDRRLIRDRISKIKKQLEQVTRTRELHRKVRRETPYPVVALVGYTNAGKSTLFNKLTGASVMAMDKLFATLDPTMRQLTLPSGKKIILSDTVGFVSNLPTELVAAFRATLEEVLEAELLLHIRDIAHPDSAAQKHDVESVLRSLFKSENVPDNVIEVRNKIDLLEHQDQTEGLGISAISGQGIDKLLTFIEREIEQRFYIPSTFTLKLDDGKALAWLHAHGKITSQEIDDDRLQVKVQLSKENTSRFEHLYASSLY
jgi:GTP-binding protein HflX